jgi:hypothetical protein
LGTAEPHHGGMMWSRLNLGFLCLGLTLGSGALRAAVAPELTPWDQVAIAPMQTSIYVGSVSLTPGIFVRHGASITTTYEAKVRPWFFWGETGVINISISEPDLARLAQGETIDFAGSATNHKNKPRSVTGRAQPLDASTGKIKVRIKADGVELIFNSTYRFSFKPAVITP